MENGDSSSSVRRSARVRRSPPRLVFGELPQQQQQQKTPAKRPERLAKVATVSVTTTASYNSGSGSRRTRSKSLAQATVIEREVAPSPIGVYSLRRTPRKSSAILKRLQPETKEKEKKKQQPPPQAPTPRSRRKKIVLDDDYSEEEEEEEEDDSDVEYLEEEEASPKKKSKKASAASSGKKRQSSAPPASRRKKVDDDDDLAPNKLKLTRKRTADDHRRLSPEEAIQAAMDRFHSSSVPDSLPCREEQFEKIYEFVVEKLEDGQGGCMYISGVPGTGKTTTLYEVRRTLEANRRHLPSFKWVEVNGVRLGDPKQFYPQLHMELTGEKRTVSQAVNALNDRFSNGGKSSSRTGSSGKPFTTILLVDELDFLRTKSQHLLYNIFDWPTRAAARLVVLAIANTMDLPERLLLKFSSRIAFARQVFSPYSYQELERIVAARLQDLAGRHHVAPGQVFEPDALQLICRKVAAHSGDARRVLDIARRSAELTMAAGRATVTLADVSEALAEIFRSVNVYRVSAASAAERTFLRALLADFRSTGLEEARFIDVYGHYVELCRLEGLAPSFIPTTSQLGLVAANLDQSKVILLQKSPSHLYRRVSLLISADDVTFALNSEDE